MKSNRLSSCEIKHSFVFFFLLPLECLSFLQQRKFPTDGLRKVPLQEQSWSKTGSLSQVWWLTSVITALWRLRQEDGRWPELQKEKPPLKKKKGRKKKKETLSNSSISLLIFWHIKQSSFSKFKISKLYKEIKISFCTFGFFFPYDTQENSN